MSTTIDRKTVETGRSAGRRVSTEIRESATSRPLGHRALSAPRVTDVQAGGSGNTAVLAPATGGTADRRRFHVRALIVLAMIAGALSSALNGDYASATTSATLTVKPGAAADKAGDVSIGTGQLTTSFLAPSTNADFYAALEMRSTSKGSYRAKVRLLPNRTMSLSIVRVNGTKETYLGGRTLPYTYKVNQRIFIQSEIGGVSPVVLKARSWAGGTSTPEWQSAAVDSSTSRHTSSAPIRFWAFLSSKATSSVKVPFSDLGGKATTVTPIATPTPTPTPTTQPTTAPTTPAPTTAPTTPAPTTQPTTAPTPTPTPSASTGKPSASSVGVPAGVTLKRHDGNITITQDGTHLNGLDIHGFVDVKANNVKITNSIIRGGKGTSFRGLLMSLSKTGLVIEDSEFKPEFQTVYLDGIIAQNFTARRIHVQGGVDNVKITGDNSIITDSLLENTVYYSSDPNQGGGPTHNDNIQISKGKNIVLQRNTIRGAQTHTILGQAAQGPTALKIDGNWLDGAICGVKLQIRNGYQLTGTVSNNKFGPNRVYSKCKISVQNGISGVSAWGNVMEMDGSNADTILREN